jgi:hypothetical protein
MRQGEGNKRLAAMQRPPLGHAGFAKPHRQMRDTLGMRANMTDTIAIVKNIRASDDLTESVKQKVGLALQSERITSELLAAAALEQDYAVEAKNAAEQTKELSEAWTYVLSYGQRELQKGAA